MHYYEKNVIEIKQEYTSFLINIMTPLVYEGIKTIYDKALNMEKQFKQQSISDPSVQNPGVLKIFQMYLKDIQSLNNHLIQVETNRIKEKSKCSEWFDDLVKAVVKSNIILLTYNASGKKCKLVKQKYHEDIKTEIFIHKSYIECARLFYNYSEIFFHKYSTIDIKRNQREAYNLIKEAINEAIRKMLPIKLILEEYLKNDYIDDDNDISSNIPRSRYTNLKTLVKRDLLEDDIYNNDEDENEYYGNQNDQSAQSNNNKYINSYNNVLDEDDDTDIEDKINDLDNIIDGDDKNDNMSDNLKDLIYANDTHATDITDNQENNTIQDQTNIITQDEQKIKENDDIKNDKKTDEPENNNGNKEEKKYDYSKGIKVLESMKKPKNVMTDLINQYKKITKPIDSKPIDSKPPESKQLESKQIESKHNASPIHNNVQKSDTKNENNSDTIDIKINKKMDNGSKFFDKLIN